MRALGTSSHTSDSKRAILRVRAETARAEIETRIPDGIPIRCETTMARCFRNGVTKGGPVRREFSARVIVANSGKGRARDRPAQYHADNPRAAERKLYVILTVQVVKERGSADPPRLLGTNFQRLRPKPLFPTRA